MSDEARYDELGDLIAHWSARRGIQAERVVQRLIDERRVLEPAAETAAIDEIRARLLADMIARGLVSA